MTWLESNPVYAIIIWRLMFQLFYPVGELEQPNGVPTLIFSTAGVLKYGLKNSKETEKEYQNVPQDIYRQLGRDGF